MIVGVFGALDNQLSFPYALPELWIGWKIWLKKDADGDQNKTLLLQIWRRMSMERGSLGSVPPLDYVALSPWKEWLWVGRIPSGVLVECLSCGKVIERFEKHLPPPPTSPQQWPQKTVTVLFFSEFEGTLEASSSVTSLLSRILPKRYTMQLIRMHFAELVNPST